MENNLYVIKFNNGCYWCGYNHIDKQLRKAVIYKSIKIATDSAVDCMKRKSCIKNSKDITDWQIVEVELREKKITYEENVLFSTYSNIKKALYDITNIDENYWGIK